MILMLAVELLAAAILLGLACAGGVMIFWTLVSGNIDLLTRKPWNCAVCLSSYGSAVGGLALFITLQCSPAFEDHMGTVWAPIVATMAGLLVSGGSVAVSVLILKLKQRLEA